MSEHSENLYRLAKATDPAITKTFTKVKTSTLLVMAANTLDEFRTDNALLHKALTEVGQMATNDRIERVRAEVDRGRIQAELQEFFAKQEADVAQMVEEQVAEILGAAEVDGWEPVVKRDEATELKAGFDKMTYRLDAALKETAELRAALRTLVHDLEALMDDYSLHHDYTGEGYPEWVGWHDVLQGGRDNYLTNWNEVRRLAGGESEK